MATFTLRSRTFGVETFWVRDTATRSNPGYVRLECGSQHGELGQQICYGGGIRGSAVECGADDLEATVRDWHRGRMRAKHKMECA